MNQLPVRVINTDSQYHAYLEEIENLIMNTSQLTPELNEKLELLTVLVNDYESKNYQFDPIDPIDAIKFKMEEKGLKQVDLVPYFGTKSRVSEVLSRKKPLTIHMIKALARGLGIPADTLLGLDQDDHDSFNITEKSNIDWLKFPFKEMVSRGWIEKVSIQKKEIERQVKDYIESMTGITNSIAFKRTMKGEGFSPATLYSLHAWIARVIQKSRENRNTKVTYDSNVINKNFLRELAQLSWFETGPVLAVEFLQKHGISVVIEPSLKGTLVDGAALKDSDETPIIALTLRHDRLDNFWFTLLHEVVHIWKHIDSMNTIIDDLDRQSIDKNEAEANRITRDTFIPRVVWKNSNAFLSPSKTNIDLLSRELKIHPAIIAGRLRRERNDFTIFSDLVGYGEVKKHFPRFLSEV